MRRRLVTDDSVDVGADSQLCKPQTTNSGQSRLISRALTATPCMSWYAIRSSLVATSTDAQYRHVVRRSGTSLTIMPLRDRGLYRTDFTLQAFAPDNLSINLERISTTLPFSTTITGQMTSRNAGGHAGLPSWIDNPQYKLVVAAPQGVRRAAADALRVVLQGETDMAWNVKVLWGKGELVSE